MTRNLAGLRYPHEAPPGEGQATQVAPGIMWMRLPLPMALDHVNVFALDDGDAGWTLVDTGFASKRSRALWQKLIAGPLAGRPIHRVIVTHHHPDHVGLAGWFQTEYGAKLWTTRTAWLMARMLVLDEQPVPTPEALRFWRQAGMPADMLAERAGQRPFNFADVVAPMPVGFRRIAEGSRLTAAGRDWTVRVGNGHAPEHATLWDDAGEIVIGGDQLLPSISPNIGVYPTEPEADPVGDWLAACEHLQPHATDTQLVLPGHKLPFTGLPLRLTQMIDNHHGALARLMELLSEPRTAVDCFPSLFKRKIGPDTFGLALVEALAHLNHLHQLGKVDRTPRPDGAWAWQRSG